MAQGYFGRAFSEQSKERAVTEMLQDGGPVPDSAAEQPDKVVPLSVCSCVGRRDTELLPALALGGDNSSPKGPMVLARDPTVTLQCK